jgi:predicted ABC-type ATPase
MPTKTLTVLAGVNGAGKSSVGGEALRAAGAVYFNPDEYAKQLRAKNKLSQEQANAMAWSYGKDKLEDAIAHGTDYTFESTLGGKSITALLIQAVQAGHRLEIWFVGLESVELHLERVALRVNKGGHPIPETAIRKRWIGSRENIIRLIPYVTTLRVFDNSREATEGETVLPVLLLSIEESQLTYPSPEDLTMTPRWAKPIIAAAYKHFGLFVDQKT